MCRRATSSIRDFFPRTAEKEAETGGGVLWLNCRAGGEGVGKNTPRASVSISVPFPPCSYVRANSQTYTIVNTPGNRKK